MFINNFKHYFFLLCCFSFRLYGVFFCSFGILFLLMFWYSGRDDFSVRNACQAKSIEKKQKQHAQNMKRNIHIHTFIYTGEEYVQCTLRKKNQQQHSITGLVIQWVENYAQPLRFLICIGNSAHRELWLCICVFCILNFFTTILTSYLILWIIYGFNWCMIRSLININIILIRYLILFSLRLLFLCWMYNNFAQFRSLNILLKPDELYIFQCV